MSIELLPPKRVYPNKYYVDVNFCNCHPETCSCDQYAVYYPLSSKKYSSFYSKNKAQEIADILNKDNKNDN